jgi:phosphoserine aminotransferase
MLPLEVLQKAQSELVNYGESGMSVMEMSHRSKEYEAIIETAEADLRTLMAIPDSYTVLFLQGGASLQFDMIPMNLMTGSKKADFVLTGQWAKRAIEEASKFGTANVVASSADKIFNYIPDLDPKTFSKDADYFHITLNNTIYGTRFKKLPDVGSIPLVADMSSSILSEQVDITKFGLLYAGAQKNLGPAGVTVVIPVVIVLIPLLKIRGLFTYKTASDIHKGKADHFNDIIISPWYIHFVEYLTVGTYN